LLLKTPSGYRLTEAGEAILDNIERIEHEVQAVNRRIAGKDLSLEGTVRLTTVETLAAEILSPVLAAFRLSYPAVHIEIVAATRSLSLTKREADVALRVAPFTQADLVARKVGAIEYGLYASDGYLRRFGQPDWHTGAADHCLIVTEPDLLETPEMRWLRGLAPAASAVLVSNSRLIHRAAAANGLGIACLARYLGDPVSGLVRLTPPVSAEPAPVRDLWLGLHGDMRHMPRIRAFTDALRDGLKRSAERLRPTGP
jgi:DNA-binding transcriptional LysR family regulator